jgi:hypothetical protein
MKCTRARFTTGETVERITALLTGMRVRAR